MGKPQGRRHDAFTDYHQRIQMGDEVHGYDAEAVSHSDFCTALETSRSTATACCIWRCPESLHYHQQIEIADELHGYDAEAASKRHYGCKYLQYAAARQLCLH